jgi:hypothetical protein
VRRGTWYFYPADGRGGCKGYGDECSEVDAAKRVTVFMRVLHEMQRSALGRGQL